MFIKKVTILAKYIDFVNVFSKKLAIKLSKYLYINKYAINPEKDKQLIYKLIYSLELIKLESFKTYFKTNLANSFI